MNKELRELCNGLDYARGAVMSCLDGPDVLVDMHGLTYWAGEVERLRKEIKESV